MISLQRHLIELLIQTLMQNADQRSPSVFYWVFLNGAAGGEGGGGVWSLNQLPLDMRSNHQLVKVLTSRDKQTFA